MKLVYSKDAVEDLTRLRECIAEHNPDAANRIASELVEKIQFLSRFPKLGSPVQLAPEPGSIRNIVFGHYVVRYSVHARTLIVLRVWHELEGER